MTLINQALSSAHSVLTYTATGAAMGALTCAVGGVVIGSAVPPIATGAIAVGISSGVSRAITLLGEHLERPRINQNPRISSLHVYGRLFGFYVGAKAATALGMPITCKATILVWLGAFPSILLVGFPFAIATIAYVRKNGIPQFVNNALDEMRQNAETGRHRERLINIQRAINQVGQHFQGIRV